ncbi:YSC84-related protein [Oceanicella sp. SM1341]|uniref:lipid-binding SYLF domain-containing protein n=1 Tax=Oceanicella sp. SM1341 TaxID=1548889 RepID=UPI000E5173FF|nr:lipid-binding SYLF domain-containing protein [Oceanicella sp. SM1341]
MTVISRRSLLTGVAGLAACSLPVAASAYTKAEIDSNVSAALEQLRKVNGAPDLMSRALGYLVMADVKKAGLLVGGEYGEGTLFVGGAPTDYYSVAAASFGLQAGIQRSNQALFFMTEKALKDFRTADGWTAGADAEITIPDNGVGVNVSTHTQNKPVIGIIFGREGLMAGASLEGAKFSRIYR